MTWCWRQKTLVLRVFFQTKKGARGSNRAIPRRPLEQSVRELAVSYFNIFISCTVIVDFSESVTPLI